MVIVALLSVLCAVRAAPASHRQSCTNSGTGVISTKLTATCLLDLQVDITVSKSCICSSPRVKELHGDLISILDVIEKCREENITNLEVIYFNVQFVP